jgi:hypothetical protein
MEIHITDDGLMIVPETEFEKDYLQHTFPGGHTYKAFLKTGLTIDDVIGLKINKEIDPT